MQLLIVHHDGEVADQLVQMVRWNATNNSRQETCVIAQ